MLLLSVVLLFRQALCAFLPRSLNNSMIANLKSSSDRLLQLSRTIEKMSSESSDLSEGSLVSVVLWLARKGERFISELLYIQFINYQFLWRKSNISIEHQCITLQETAEINYIDMNNTIDFHNLSQLNQQLLNNSQLFYRTGTVKKPHRLNLRQLGSVQSKSKGTSTSRPASNIDVVAQPTKKRLSPSPGPIDFSLPKLSQQSKRPRTKIDRTYLQQWLDSALEDEDGGGGPLRGVRKYQVDKRQLLGQNLSLEDVDKLYHSLYIYSHGMRNILGELANDNEEMILRFWRVFLRLLEKSSEFQNLFSVIQRRHNDAVDNLKKLVMKKEDQIQEQKKSYEQKMKNIVIDIQTKTRQLKDLNTQKTVLQTNFQLTDEAFTEEVSLRLRFEEKINAINTSYSELRLKFTRLLDELKVLKEASTLQSNKQRQHVDEKCVYETALLQQQQMTEAEKERSKIKDEEIDLLRQQIYDLKQNRLDIFKKDNEDEVEIKKALNKQRRVNLNLLEEIDKNKAAQSLLAEKSKEIDRLTGDLKKQRKSLEDAYSENYKLDQELIKVQKSLEDQKNLVILMERRTEIAQSNCRAATQNSEKMTLKNQSLIKQVDFLKKRIDMLDEGLTSNQKTIQSLRDAKEKFDKKYRIIQTQQKTTLQALAETNAKMFALEEEKKKYLLLIEKKQNSGNQIDAKMQIELDLANDTISSLKSQIDQKDFNYVKMGEKFDKVKNELIQRNIAFDKIQKSNFDLQTTLSRQIFQKKNIEGKAKLLDQTFQIVKKEVDRLNAIAIELRKSNTLLNNEKTTLGFLLNEKKKFTQSQYEVIKNLLHTYKQQIEAKTDFIHPMFYWDKVGYATRAESNLIPLRKEIATLKDLMSFKEKAVGEAAQETIQVRKQLSDSLHQIYLLKQQLKVKIEELTRQIQASKKNTEANTFLKEELNTKQKILQQTERRLNELDSILNKIRSTKQAMKSTQVQAVVALTTSSSQTDKISQNNMEASRDTQKSRGESSRRTPDSSPENKRNSLVFEVVEQEEQKKPNEIKEQVDDQQEYQKQGQGNPQNRQIFTPQVDNSSPNGTMLRPTKKQRAPVNMKPVTNKEFSKALKLTFMRK